MSVISEAQVGDKIVVIADFVACKYGEQFEWGCEREFQIGELVEYEDCFKDSKVSQDHLSWQVKFKTTSGDSYNAVQLNFITIDEWGSIVTKVNEQFMK